MQKYRSRVKGISVSIDSYGMLLIDSVAVDCPALTVANSDTSGVVVSTTGTRSVGCSNGYSSSSGDSFVSTCSGSSPGVSTWTNVLTCDGMLSWFESPIPCF